MNKFNNRCIGITSKGKPCELSPQTGMKYCRYHQPEKQDGKERTKVKKFLTKHKEGVIGFLGGAVSDPIASDIYDFIKEKLGMPHLVPPVKDSKKLENVSQHFQMYRDLTSLFSLINELKPGMKRQEIIELLGEPNYSHQFHKKNDLQEGMKFMGKNRLDLYDGKKNKVGWEYQLQILYDYDDELWSYAIAASYFMDTRVVIEGGIPIKPW